MANATGAIAAPGGESTSTEKNIPMAAIPAMPAST